MRHKHDFTKYTDEDIRELDRLLNLLKSKEYKTPSGYTSFYSMTGLNEKYIQILANTGYTESSNEELGSPDIWFQKLTQHGLELNSFEKLRAKQIKRGKEDAVLDWLDRKKKYLSLITGGIAIASFIISVVSRSHSRSTQSTFEHRLDSIEQKVDNIELRDL